MLTYLSGPLATMLGLEKNSLWSIQILFDLVMVMASLPTTPLMKTVGRENVSIMILHDTVVVHFERLKVMRCDSRFRIMTLFCPEIWIPFLVRLPPDEAPMI